MLSDSTPGLLGSSTVASRSRTAPAGLHLLARHPWAVLVAWTAILAVAHAGTAGVSWHYFVTAARTLTAPGGLSIYAQHPELQMGPLAFLAAAVFAGLTPAAWGAWPAFVAMLGVGLVVVRELRAILPRHDPAADRRWLLVGLGAMLCWSELAVGYGHLDDAAAIALIVVGIRLARDGRAVPAAIALAAAVDFKPWAVPFAAVLLLVPRAAWLRAAVVDGVVVAALWAPFAIAAGLVDLAVARRVIPWTTVIAIVLVYAPSCFLIDAPGSARRAAHGRSPGGVGHRGGRAPASVGRQ